MTLNEAKEQVAKNKGFNSWGSIQFHSSVHWTQMEEYLSEAAELYRLESCKETWDRACEKQKEVDLQNVSLIRGKYGQLSIDKNSILNAPKPEFKP